MNLVGSIQPHTAHIPALLNSVRGGRGVLGGGKAKGSFFLLAGVRNCSQMNRKRGTINEFNFHCI